MARYVKRGKVWQYEISYKEDGKYKKMRKSGFAKKSDAIAEASEIESKMAKGLRVTNKDIQLDAHFEQWITVYKKGKVTNTTYKKYLNTLMNIRKYFTYATLKTLTKTKYQEILNEFAKTHADATVERLNIHIRASLVNPIDEGLIPYDFTKGAVIKGESPSVNETDKYINYNEFKDLMALAKKKLDPQFASRFMIVIAGSTGMRFAELLGLTWENVDLEKGTIKVKRAWDYLDTNNFCPTKNEQSVRNVPIDKQTCLLMKWFKKQQNKLFKKLDIKPEHDFVFYNAKSGLVSNNAVNKKLKELLRQLNIDTPLTIHGLRHTHASVLIYKGVNIMAVSKHLGHKNLAVTMETYSHSIKELEEREDIKIKEIFTELNKS
ncbi:site-specific integrase [Enterococcus faecalis]|jgi:integrase|uniref:site-specific integrase n=1 Tax=Enterococcus faecalis TaxID=1351 RepID=UPI0003531EDE|nr:site-specific integrase [Enterococcus faecalis]DAL40912.1 MAG TPA_asm: Integrase [Caudoviricetes sp.]EHA4031142.1 site-specific integrase [Enterococcus faecalis]EHY9169225.1 site-specific integrase [Enterococcus faecalis]EPI26293.1 site-specific recombinase, phage integrase family [Enterococcus faecalis]EPI30848.1 site-specific recombinase, phage integrase family [Enterococcus faecalis WKS-26-18-2]